MNRILAFLTVALAFVTNDAWAQPTFRFPTEKHNAGENFCIDVKTRDFTDLLTANFTITWDPAVLRYTGVSGIQLQDLKVADFDASQASTGKLVVNWRATDQVNGVTVPKAIEENFVIFQLCFKAIGTFGASTPICIAEVPIPVVTRTGSGNLNIGLLTDKGLIGTEVLPVVIDLTEEEGEQGDFICVDVKVANFTNLQNLQFTIEFDPNLLEYDGANSYNVLPSFDPNINIAIPLNPNPVPGALTFAWYYRQPVTLADSTSIFGLCFKAKGNCRSFSYIKITGNHTVIEAVTNDEPVPGTGINIGVFPVDGSIRIKPCDNTTGLNFIGTCPEGMPGETVCVEVTCRRFTQIIEIASLIKWNPGVLEFVSATSIAPGFNPRIITTGAPDGNIRLEFMRTPTAGLTIPDNTKILRLCFKIIGNGTVNSSVSFTGSPTAIVTKQGSGTNIGLVSQNGCVIVKAPPGLTLSVDNFEGYKTEKICADIKVANFTGINKMQFSLLYPNSVVRLDSINNLRVPGMTTANFRDLGGGVIEVNWENPTGFGESLPDGSVIFRLCFTIIGDINKCGDIDFEGDPIPVNITTEENPDFNIGLVSSPGKICILDPGRLKIIGTRVSGDPGDLVCVDVSVENFNAITATQYSVRWDFSNIRFERVNFSGKLPTLTNSNFDFSNVNDGVLTLSWTDIAGATLPDGDIIFSICFKIIGVNEGCTNVYLADNPLSIFVTSAFSGTSDVGLNKEDGQVCINDYLRIIDYSIENVKCPGANDGAIFLDVKGGLRPYRFRWSGTTAITEDISNLRAGQYIVTITDGSLPMRTVTDTFEITISGEAPIADAGTDVMVNCLNAPVKLDGTNSSQGFGFEYLWTTLGTKGGIVPPGETKIDPTVLGPGTYVLKVSEGACFSYDTVVVLDPILPTADAGADQFIDCYSPEAELDGRNSVGFNLKYLWNAIGGGVLDTGRLEFPVGLATSVGTYELVVRELGTGCIDKDTVNVFSNKIYPIADAGPQQSLSCVVDTIIIGGTGTSSGPQFSYEWTAVENGNIVDGEDENAAKVNAIGLYRLIVIDNDNGCASEDTVRVIGDLNRPNSDSGPDVLLTCDSPCSRLDGSLSSSGSDFEYFWTTLSGGTIPVNERNLLNPTVCEQGVYQLLVRNKRSGCEDVSNVIVSNDKEAPRAEAGADVNLGCRDFPVLFDGEGSSDGPEFRYTWTTDGSGSIQSPNNLSTYLQGNGSYFLEILDVQNGCTARDTVRITIDTTQKPIVKIAPVVQKLTCKDASVQLNAIGSSNGTNFIFNWGPPAGILSGANTLTPKVGQAGNFTLSIVDTISGCYATKTVLVESDYQQPTAVVVQPAVKLKCDPPYAELDGTGSSTGPKFRYDWIGNAGNVPVGAVSIRAQAYFTDVYNLIVTNLENGCKDTATVKVDPNDHVVVARAGQDGELDCLVEEINFSGTGSTSGSTVKAQWFDTSGNLLANNLQFKATTPGTFVLLVKDTADGCFGRDTVSVTENKETPFADAGQNLSFDCAFGETTLTGTADANGANFTVRWTSLEGNPIQNSTTLTPTVSANGTYTIEVTNTENHCTTADFVTIEIKSNLEAAQAQIEGVECENTATLTGNLPDKATGEWSTFGSSFIEFPDNSTTQVLDIPQGEQVFIWTLSTDDCPNYSRDTVRISVSAGEMPLLRSELVTMRGDQDEIDVNLLANDDVLNLPGFTFSILSAPASGSILKEENGVITYQKETGFEGVVEITYAVCNTVCTDLCDTAFAKINIEKLDVPIDTIVPNAITPNGDGKNDELTFPVLEENSSEYPNNELVVFNRWGDVVYRASPYNNDWKGTNQSGKDLPQGTYYYILRLSVADGKILQGDVTILK